MSDEDAIDPLLRVFVEVMNTTAVQMGVSLLVGGTWLSGVVIPPRMYMQEIADEISKRAEQGSDGIRVFFDTAGRQFFPSDSEREAAGEQQPDSLPLYVHLRGARAFPGTYPVPADGFYVRIRLDQVEGWTIGVLGEPGYEPTGPPKPRE